MEGTPAANDQPANGNETPAPLPLPRTGVLVGSYIAVAVAVALAVVIAGRDDLTVTIAEGFSALAVIYIIAQAIERFLEPIASTALLGAKELEEKKAEVAAGAEAGADAAARQQATAARLRVERLQADRKVGLWAAATVIALLLSALFELGLIDAVADVKDENGVTPSWFEKLDVVITGLAIGAGTKPLHDLVSRLESAKKNADPSTKPATGQ